MYKSAPLPFQGQKRNFVKKFKEVLKQFPDDAVFIDLFGGSGLLSHTIKTEKPKATVIYNDFDNYSERLKNISRTNLLIADIRNILQGNETKQRIPEDLKVQILKRVQKDKTSGFVDYTTLSAALLFSGNYADCYEKLAHQPFYNRVIKGSYNADGYLNGVQTVCKDYKQLFEEYKDFENVVFILDPPYLSTDVKSYTNENYWKLTDYLDVLKTIENKPYVYFTSNKSQLIELMNWLSDNNYGYNPFQHATTTTTTNIINHSSSYTDIMIYKNRTLCTYQ